MFKKKYLLIFLILISFSVFSKNQEEVIDNGKITVYTSVLPQLYFAREIGGDRVECEALVSPAKSPATYQPTPNQIVGLGSADLLFTIGVPFENTFLDKFKSTLTNLKIVDTSDGINKRTLALHHHDDEEEEHSAEEEEGGIDPHVWLSPVLAKTISANIYNNLVELDPEGKDYYTNRYNLLVEKLEALNNELHKILEPVEGKILFVYHPSFGYFADEYGLEQIAIETGGKEPTASQLTHIIDEAVEEEVKIIIVQPEFSQKSANIIATSIKGTVTTLNPLDPDYIENLRSIADTILKAYSN